MDKMKIVALLRATMDPVQRKGAEKELNRLKNIIGAVPALLEVVMSNEIDLPIRQAGVIYLKNLILRCWTNLGKGEIQRFVIDENDKSMLKDILVDAVIFSPPKIRAQLCLCVQYICQSDFPAQWPFLIQNICTCIENSEAKVWPGALSLVLALVQSFDSDDDETPLVQAMNLVLPKVQELMVRHLLNDDGQLSLSSQQLALKLFYTLTKLDMTVTLTKDHLTTWMEIILTILDRKNPDYEKIPEDEDARDNLVTTGWWKTKKWAMHILFRIFEDYVSPASKYYMEFSTWYVNTFSARALQVIFNMLDAYRKKEFVTDNVLTDGLSYLENSLSYADMWKLIKPFASAIISDVIYPLMCFSKADETLWTEDAIEFSKVKYGDSRDVGNDAAFAAEQLLHSMCQKRKGILPNCLAFITQVLNSPNSTPEQIDGGLYMFGSITDVLLTKNEYQDQFENVISGFVFPLFASKISYLRSRVAWLLLKLSKIKFTREDVLQETIRLLLTAILNKEEELPVKVQAALTIQAFISNQIQAHKYIQPQVPQLSIELLEMLRATEYDDLTSVLRGIVCDFVEDLAPVANNICTHLAQTFFQVIESAHSNNNKMMISMGVVNTMETLICVMDDQPTVCQSLEPILVQVIRFIFEKSLSDFYTEGFSLIESLTDCSISSVMWEIFELIYRVVERDGVDFFKDMAPALYNYMTADTEAFLSDQSRLLAICAIVQEVFAENNSSLSGGDAQCHAAKLMEVLILQFRHRIQNIIPTFVQLLVSRLSRPCLCVDFRTSFLQVILAALYHDAALTISVLPSLDTFIQQWATDADSMFGLHERRICVLGFCSLLDFLSQQRQNFPPALEQHKTVILPLLIFHLNEIKGIYASRALAKVTAGKRNDHMKMDHGSCDSDVLDSDEDEINDDDLHDENGCDTGSCGHSGTTNDEEDLDSEFNTIFDCYATPLDEADCPVDEYIVFKQCLLNLQNCDSAWYDTLTAALNGNQRKSIDDIFHLADARKEAALSKQIKKNGAERRSDKQQKTVKFNTRVRVKVYKKDETATKMDSGSFETALFQVRRTLDGSDPINNKIDSIRKNLDTWQIPDSDVLDVRRKREQILLFTTPTDPVSFSENQQILILLIDKWLGYGFSPPQPVPAVFNFGTLTNAN